MALPATPYDEAHRAIEAADRFVIRQRFTPLVNQYDIYAAGPAGEAREQVAFVQQKRMKLKEEFTVYADPARQLPLASVKAAKVLDFGSGYQVTASDGTPLGTFRKRFAASLLRSSFELADAEGRLIVGRERSLVLALFRRLADLIPVAGGLLGLIPVLFHFDLRREDDTLVATVERRLGIRDEYRLTITPEGAALDRRMAIALGVATDALLSR